MSKPLLQRNTWFLLKWLPVVLLSCCILFYVLMRMQAHHMQEKQLLLKQHNVWTAFLAKQGTTERHIVGEYDIAEAIYDSRIALDVPRDTSLYYADKNKFLPFQILTRKENFNGKIYQITTYVSSNEINHLIIKVFFTEAMILFLLLIAIVLLNKKSAGLLWQSFFFTVKKVNEFDITKNSSLILPFHTGTTEFDELNKVVNNLISNVNTAYHNQKQFVENASHEMQTPLAIIRSKLELLINQPNITEKSAFLLGDITEANDRLSQMNRTLLLLAKIENNQFPDTENIDVSQMLGDIVNNFKNYYDNFPKVDAQIENDVMVNANRSLIEILISNLVKNAIEHNITEGQIKIHLSHTNLIIENTGLPLQVNAEELFERFKKGSHKTKTTGLGLALIRQICTLYHYPVSYHYNEGWHKVMATLR
ncbi:MAG: HAMP domain-containing histidine kinase [Ferruginibacter sp.]|nr:HAMP domain-containing histidine kinase [Ferruginibacter sp.]